MFRSPGRKGDPPDRARRGHGRRGRSVGSCGEERVGDEVEGEVAYWGVQGVRAGGMCGWAMMDDDGFDRGAGLVIV